MGSRLQGAGKFTLGDPEGFIKQDMGHRIICVGQFCVKG